MAHSAVECDGRRLRVMERKEQKVFRRYDDHIEVCGRCGGEGILTMWPENDPYKLAEPIERECPLCEGSGLVRKRMQTVVDIEPYKPRRGLN